MTVTDAEAEAECSAPEVEAIEITESRESRVGAFRVRRALPRRGRRTVGAWCFVDHMGPAAITEDRGLDVAPHPHIGLQTVTWLFEGEAVHRDSLGTEQVITPGELNLMTAGHGVAHSEEGTGRYRGELHGVQLWVAQPSATRDGPAAFEHHAELPKLDFEAAVATVLVGELDGLASPARHDTDHVGVDLELRSGTTTVPLRADFEYAVVVFTGGVTLGRRTIDPGRLAYLGLGREEIALSVAGRSRALLFGGVPFDEPVLMWWNYVARDREEIVKAHAEWSAGGERFGRVDSVLPRIEVAPPPWAR
ncbi:MAG TPA: pirin family protein [Acidimicrobiales bacterium]|nr:pirin family protein [Acidimicrobiales bacterium]